MGLVLVQTLFILINLIIGIYDFSFYRIPNILLGALLGLYVISAPFYLSINTMFYSVIVCLVVLAVTFSLFAMRVIGGGDAKYLTVTSLWVGTSGILPFIFLVTVIGGFLAILYITGRNYIQRFSDWVWQKIQNLEQREPKLQYVWAGSGAGPEQGKRENISSRMLPYGIAIAVAAIIIIINNPLKGL